MPARFECLERFHARHDWAKSQEAERNREREERDEKMKERGCMNECHIVYFQPPGREMMIRALLRNLVNFGCLTGAIICGVFSGAAAEWPSGRVVGRN